MLPPSRGNSARPTRRGLSAQGCSRAAGAVPWTIPSLRLTAHRVSSTTNRHMRAPKGLSPLPGLGGRSARRCRHIKKGGFDPVHEDLRLRRPRHALYSLLRQILLYGRGEYDHRHIRLSRGALAHSAEEGFAYTLIESGCK